MESNTSDPNKKDTWDKIQVAAVALGALAIPVILSIFGHIISINIKAQDVSTKMIELSVDILKSVPKRDEDRPIREWAVAILDKHSGIDINATAREALSSRPIFDDNNVGLGLLYACANIRASVYLSDHGYIPNMASINRSIRGIEADGKCLVGENIPIDSDISNLIAKGLNIKHSENSEDSNPYASTLEKPCKKHQFYVYVSPIDGVHTVENDQECVVFITMD